MKQAWIALFASRKFWVGLTAIVSIVLAVILRVFDKIPPDALYVTAGGLSAVALGIINGIATEDSAKARISADALHTVDIYEAASRRPTDLETTTKKPAFQITDDASTKDTSPGVSIPKE